MPKLRALSSNESLTSPGIKDLTPDKSMGSEEKKLSLEVLEELPEQNSIEEEAEAISEEDEDEKFSFDSEQARLDMEKMNELTTLGENLKSGLDQKVSIVQGAHINPPKAT